MNASAFGLTQILLLAGVLQALQLCLVLALRGDANRAARASLQALLGVCALVLVDYLLLRGGWYLRAPGLAGFSLPLLFALGPLLLGYIVCHTGGQPRVAWLWHAAPAAACAVLLWPWWSMDAVDKSAWLAGLLTHGYRGSQIEPLLASLLLCLHFVVCSYQAGVVLDRYDAALRQQETGTVVQLVRWLQLVIRGFCLFQLLFYLSWVEWLYFVPEHWHYTRLTMGALAGLLVLAGSWSQLHPELFRRAALAPLPLLSGVTPEPRQGRARLEPAQLAECMAALERCMREQRPYLDPELRLHKLAGLVQWPAHLLSQVLNEGMGCNFFEYVNRKRVAHAQAQLRAAAGTRPNLLEVALAAGFNSKATFNRSFRQATGTTPSAYLAETDGSGATDAGVNRYERCNS